MGGSVTNILNKQMSRRQFVSYIGIIALTLLGIPSLLKSLTDLGTPQKRKVVANSNRRFGTGAYGV
jgi:hypothetical protein